MHRLLPTLIVTFTMIAVASFARAQAPAADCTSASCRYLPLVAKPEPTPTATFGPTAIPPLPPPSYNNCQADPNPGAAPNYPVRITAIDKAAETVTLQNVSTAPIDLTGWNMCSITGNQHHPIGGVLAAGQFMTFTNTGGPIWNNSVRDDGALYNPSGQLVSYYVD
jgi:hypothetical protein